MAATPTPKPTRAEDNPALAPLRGWQATLPVAVAYSGGADSTALLLAACVAWPGQVSAIHVNHNLQTAAMAFEEHSRQACGRLGVPLHVASVDARHQSGQSPEDAARQSRYLALAEAGKMLGAGSVLLAQHADDQVETLLLALSRGAGLPGLAAMPARFERHGMQFGRPLLDLSAVAIRDWLANEGVSWVEDPSNADASFTRNRIRLQLLPALEQAFPQFRDTFARSAAHAAQAQEVLSALAGQDLSEMDGEPSIGKLQQLPHARQANALRHWLRTVHGVAASAAQMEELLAQLASCTTRGHNIRIKVADGFVTRSGAVLAFGPSL